MQQVENTIVNERLYPPFSILLFADDKPECDCGDYAKLRINGKLRCRDCAEDEGVEIL